MIKYVIIAIGLAFLYTGIQIDHAVATGIGAAIVAFGLLRGGVK